jgi:predicted MPP superfamily phosphohydrolase
MLETMLFTRRRFVQGMLAGAVVGGIGGSVSSREPHHPVARSITIDLPRLPEQFDGFRLAQLSDIHYGPYIGKADLESALSLIEPFHPDLLVLTGDFVSHPFGQSHGPAGARNAEPCSEALVQLKSCPLVAILGNHDHWNGAQIVSGALRAHGIKLLRNASFPIERENRRLWVAGVDDVLNSVADLDRALAGIPQSESTILLAHEPDFADEAARYPVDLQLSGHSHGGQVRIPGIGPLILPRLARKYPTGLNRVGNLQVYTNCGLGVITPPVRLFCPPEVTLITLHKATA